MKKELLVFTAITLLSLAGCSSGGSDDDSGGIVPVSYTVDCAAGPTCNNVTKTSSYSSGSYQSVDCTWYCSSYKGQEGVYVSLDFVKRGNGCYAFDREYISSGICN